MLGRLCNRHTLHARQKQCGIVLVRCLFASPPSSLSLVSLSVCLVLWCTDQAVRPVGVSSDGRGPAECLVCLGWVIVLRGDPASCDGESAFCCRFLDRPSKDRIPGVVAGFLS